MAIAKAQVLVDGDVMLKMAGRFLAMALLAFPLAGCFDGTIDVALTSATTARVEARQVVNADTYAMIKQSSGTEGLSAVDEFCPGGAMTENADGGATCTRVEQGAFAKLRDFTGEDSSLTFVPEANGAIRVSMSTAGVAAMARRYDDVGSETLEMVEAFLAGHTMTLRIGGGEITETNLTLAGDKQSAQAVYPLLDLVMGKIDLPQSFYAVVRPN